MTRVLKAAIAAAAVALALVAPALGHQSVISPGEIRTWTHGDHANDPIGVAACLQNRHGLTKCPTHAGYTFVFVAPYPQVPPNPVYRGVDRLLTTVPVGYEWWWVTLPDGTVCVYDWRTYLPPIPGREDHRQVACLHPDDTTLEHPFDVGAKDPNPPPDFIRAEAAV